MVNSILDHQVKDVRQECELMFVLKQLGFDFTLDSTGVKGQQVVNTQLNELVTLPFSKN